MKDLVLNAEKVQSVIHCGEGAFKRYAPELAARQIFVVTDSNVFAFYRYLIWETFGNDCKIEVLPAGEKSKNPKNLIEIIIRMSESGMRRNCTVVAFGGGVIGDIAGLAAALYMRGTHLVQIPTTLLAQVDSSVGGKTAVDIGNIKNAMGTFYQPEEVIADPVFFETLPEKEIKCGLGEIVKYGALDGGIYNRLKNCENLFDLSFLSSLVFDCIRHKAEVVQKDEFDGGGVRKSLNLGHTTGHALELYYKKRSHGEYVLIGMFYELFIARKLGICGGQYANSLEKLIVSVIKKPPVFGDLKSAVKLAMQDKKNTDERISIVLPKCEGEWEEVKLSADEYLKYLQDCSEYIKKRL